MKSYTQVLLAAVWLFVTLSGCGNDEKQISEERHAPKSEAVHLTRASIGQIGLETEVVTPRPLTGYLTIPAEVMTNQNNEALIGSLVQGRVHHVYVNTGDFVKSGQVLMTVEGLDVGEIKAGFLKAKASLNYAKTNYERQKKLFEEKIGSQKALLESQAEYEKALAGYKAEDKRIHSVGLSDEDLTDEKQSDEHTSGTLPIKSPISGIVVERNVVIGQLVEAATNAFRVINTSSVWVDGQMFEKDIAKINQKSEAAFTSAAYQDDSFKGRIIYIGQIVNEQTRTITIRGDFVNRNGKLKPQMYGELHIPVGENAQAVMIPSEALVREPGRDFVFIQTNDTTFIPRKVVPGMSENGRIEIREGLKEGERFVSKGVFYLKSERKKEEIAGDEH